MTDTNCPLPRLWSHPSLTTVTSSMLGQQTVGVGRGLEASCWKALLLAESLTVAQLYIIQHLERKTKKQHKKEDILWIKKQATYNEENKSTPHIFVVVILISSYTNRNKDNKVIRKQQNTATSHTHSDTKANVKTDEDAEPEGGKNYNL